MLTKLQNQPFKYTISNLKKIIDSQRVEKEQDQIKRSLKTLSQISNLNQFLTILLDYHWFNRLCSVFEKLNEFFSNLMKKQENLQTQENLPGSPLKTFDQNKDIILRGTKHIDLTPSTKKSRVMSSPSMKILLEELVQGLQKFDQIKHNSKRIKLLIEQIHEQLHIQPEEDSQTNEDIFVQIAWKRLSQVPLQKIQKQNDFPLGQDKVQYLKQLLQQIQIIHKFMEVIKTTTQEIFIQMQHKSLDELDNQSRDSSNMEACTRKSNNPSEQRSLLTEMLRDSSQKSNIQIHENQYSSQIVLRPRFKQYSQKQDLAFLDEQYKLSSKSAKPHGKSHKLIRSEMSYGNGEQHTQSRFTVKRKEVKLKRSEMGCSQCQIF